MKKTLLAAIIVTASAGTASAGGIAGSLGVGAEFQISGLGGLSVNYDAGKFHAGGFLGYFDPAGPGNSTVDVGGRFFYHLASTASSDFSVGGSLGIQSVNRPAGGNNRATDVFLEPGFQIRAFVVPNVALSLSGGFIIGAADASELDVSGNVVAEAGVHYYF